ncbi:MAG: redoxin domain-containing protein [Bdellovibrionia bacterium]
MGRIILEPGQVAPNFQAATLSGKSITLSDCLGSPVWLIFYRYAGCPICNLHLMALTHRDEILKNINLKVIAVFDSAKNTFPKTLAGEPYPTFPIIPDPQHKLYDLYGTSESLAGVAHPKVAVDFFKAMFKGFRQGKITGHTGQMPAHFLIDPDGVLDTIYYGRHAADHIPWTAVDSFVDRSSVGMWRAGEFR